MKATAAMWKLVESIHMKIECDGCGMVKLDYCGDELDFAQFLSEEGWRVTRNENTLCPKCKSARRRKEGK